MQQNRLCHVFRTLLWRSRLTTLSTDLTPVRRHICTKIHYNTFWNVHRFCTFKKKVAFLNRPKIHILCKILLLRCNKSALAQTKVDCLYTSYSIIKMITVIIYDCMGTCLSVDLEYQISKYLGLIWINVCKFLGVRHKKFIRTYCVQLQRPWKFTNHSKAITFMLSSYVWIYGRPVYKQLETEINPQGETQRSNPKQMQIYH